MTELPDTTTHPDNIVGAVDWNILDALTALIRLICEVIA